jgi:hypothetical protein
MGGMGLFEEIEWIHEKFESTQEGFGLSSSN